MQNIVTDFLIIGSGVAGLRSAIELAKHGEVLVVTKDAPSESSSEYAQGGVAVALSDEDEVGIHYEDTIKAGDGLCTEEAVKVLVQEGPERILELIEWGTEFDRSGSKLCFTLEAAHSRKRILHCHGDSTGKEIMRTLLRQVRSLPNIKKLPFSIASELIVKDQRCLGAYVITPQGPAEIFAKAVILCTGGAGQIYCRTTNPQVVTGDGIAMAYKAGALIKDMEFVQFHPTTLYAPTAPQFLLSEAMRGEGAILRNIFMQEFMSSYHPKAELAPRDVVSRAIVYEMIKCKSDKVFLDLRHLDCEFIKNRFPKIFNTCLKYDINICYDLAPVSPAAHYFMGGVYTDINAQTTIEGLFSAGECACTGVHGANRLASNSLLEGLVFGYRSALQASKLKNQKIIKPDKPSHLSSFDPEPADLNEMRAYLRRTMWDYVGIIRSEQSLLKAKDAVNSMFDITTLRLNTRSGIELQNMLIVSMLVIDSALKRKKSVGAHFREDYP